MRCFMFYLLMIVANQKIVLAQEVEHNYQVEPKNTDCQSLMKDSLNDNTAFEKIRSTTFRFQQSFRLTRQTGLQKAEFYSCDGKYGYLLIRFNEEQQLYKNIDINLWQEMTHSSDPEGYFKQNIMNKN